MPKVTQRFRDQQMERILAAAEQCFAASGFHATSMDQIVAAAGMSSSTVYRYFPDGKQAITRAVSERRMGPLVARLNGLVHADEVPSLEDAFVSVVQSIGAPRAADDPRSDAARFDLAARIAVSAWGERDRDRQLRSLMRDNYGAIRTALVALVRRWLADSTIVTSLSPEDAAELFQHAAFGAIAEQAIVGGSDLPAAGRRLGMLLGSRDS